MRVLKIAPTPFFADRGCHIRILEETKSLLKLGNEVMICTYHNGENVNGLDIKRIPRIPWYKKLEAGPSVHMPYLDALLLIRSLQYATKWKPDVLHAHLHEGALIGNICSKVEKIPSVVDLQGSLVGEMIEHGFIKESNPFCKFLKNIENIINNSADAIMVSSENMAENLKNNFDVDSKSVFIVPDGVDTNVFNPFYDTDGLRSKLGIEKGKKIVVYLGLLNEYQGVDILINSIPHVVREVKDVHFLIMGYPNVEKYQRMAEELKIKDYVTFTGKLSYFEAPLYLNLGDIAVSPKIALSGEGNGKLYNYMACGLPSVVFESPTNREILGDVGIYAEYMNVESLSKKMIRLLLDHRKREEISNRSLEKIKKYSWDSVGRRIMEVYESVI